ncbi:hypothetical protein [Cupriavidus oxalaticus]|uniref:Uncharacterized protein n=1 Tax=Cupriavidus oxalaticus TaxID=96344 RepID=A0A4P7LKS0_9BURK|nr:hypothetical protein [Cupriavidus oxalaticus]QBY56435.1 hypothetical protein E0W60_36175 [Cupriavidus oxalaticus]
MNFAAAALAGPAAALDVVAGESRRRLALELVRRDRTREAAALCLAILNEEPDGRQWLAEEVVAAMEQAALGFAGDLAAILTGIERGSAWHPAWIDGRTRPIADARLSVGKLRHDLDQCEHLRRRGVDVPLDEIIAEYKAALARLSGSGGARTPLTDQDEQSVGRAFGRLVHVAEAPRVTPRALSPTWDRWRVQRHYLERRPSVVVIDDFLTPEALKSLLHFCQDSTIWAGNRYAHGRLSTLFFTGFNAPLVLQIAEEIRDAFPLIIGERHPLRQLWAFKNTEVLPGGSTIHADFAAINVNFWITPDEANLETDSGGMVVYDLEAPISWTFREYNERPDLIRELMTRHQPRAIRIPYRQNRAIIFNSDLFHGTEAVCFRPDYLSHRINVTMLYGDRRLDEHHAEPELAPEAPVSVCAAWRSAALARRRH